MKIALSVMVRKRYTNRKWNVYFPSSLSVTHKLTLCLDDPTVLYDVRKKNDAEESVTSS